MDNDVLLWSQVAGAVGEVVGYLFVICMAICLIVQLGYESKRKE